MIVDTAGSSEHGQIYNQYANFADDQFSLLDAQRPEMARLRLLQIRRHNDIREMELTAKNQGHHVEHRHADSRKVAEQDDERLNIFSQAHDAFLRLAMRMKIKVVLMSDEHDDVIFRLCSLWFAHHSDDKLNTEMSKELASIPSTKFAFLAHQLSARLSKSTSSSSVFQKILGQIVHRLCQEHPFHILYQLYALRQSGPVIAPVVGKKPRASLDSSSQANRASAAEDVFNKVRRLPASQQRVQLIEQACEAYTEWALVDARTLPEYNERKRNRTAEIAMPQSLKLRRLKDLPIPVVTYHLQLDPLCKYDSTAIPTISCYSDVFTTAGGVNLPKITDCIGSDGLRYKQLVSCVLLSSCSPTYDTSSSSRAVTTPDRTQSWSKSLAWSTSS